MERFGRLVLASAGILRRRAFARGALRLAVLGLAALIVAAGAAQAAVQVYGAGSTGKRVALVIGQGHYRYVAQLVNPPNDARLMARTLRGLGFTLVGGGPQLDLDKAGFDRAVRAFGRQIEGVDVALFYYAGHGLQVNGTNWLVPVSANPTRVADLGFDMVDAQLVLTQMQAAGTKLNMLILDACRNNPFRGRGLRAVGGGLAEMRAPEGTLISYATQPGAVASDGSGHDSPYTTALARTMRRPGLDIFRLFNQVGLAVKQATGGEQQPWVSSSPISGDFYFVPPKAQAAGAGIDRETVFWQSIQNSRRAADFEAYLAQYPRGSFAALARNRLAELRGPQVASLPPAAAPTPAPAAAAPVEAGPAPEPVPEPPNGPKQFTGAGATFPYPVLAKWANAYHAQTGVGLNYQAIGSGGGIKQLEARIVDFGVTDAPLTRDELDKHGLVQWPIVMGGVVPVVNLPGVRAGDLRLDGPTLAGIYIGRITRWDDPAIAALNGGLQLPRIAISVIHRSDGADATYWFTRYLSTVDREWNAKVGAARAVSWPMGLGGKGDAGVANYVSHVTGAVGYVEYAYALQNRIASATLRNRDGAFVKPSAASFQAAAAHADWNRPQDGPATLLDLPGRDTWPIVMASYVVMPRAPGNPAGAAAALRFFAWAYARGADMAAALDYVAMPGGVARRIEQGWSTLRTADGRSVWGR